MAVPRAIQLAGKEARGDAIPVYSIIPGGKAVAKEETAERQIV